MKAALLATFYHTLELAVCIVAAIVLLRNLNLGTDETRVIIGVAMNALVKFARANPAIPVNDYVNNPK